MADTFMVGWGAPAVGRGTTIPPSPPELHDQSFPSKDEALAFAFGLIDAGEVHVTLVGPNGLSLEHRAIAALKRPGADQR
jgi:hypothetical protein